MHAKNFNLADYFERIKYSGNTSVTQQALAAIMRAQLFAIPFENLDVQAGKIVSLVPEEIVEKIIYTKRGGYCYEVNGLFTMALQVMGFDYYFVAARPMFYPTRRPKTHMAVVVKLDGQEWLCDLGFGSFGIRAPMSLQLIDQSIQQDDDFFRLIKADQATYVMQASVDGEWTSQYGFDLHPQEWIDFMPVNYLNSTHPDTIFVQKLLVIKHNPLGRKVLLDNRLKIIEKGISTTKDLSNKEVQDLLADEFELIV